MTKDRLAINGLLEKNRIQRVRKETTSGAMQDLNADRALVSRATEIKDLTIVDILHAAKAIQNFQRDQAEGVHHPTAQNEDRMMRALLHVVENVPDSVKAAPPLAASADRTIRIFLLVEIEGFAKTQEAEVLRKEAQATRDLPRENHSERNLLAIQTIEANDHPAG
jgi:hypothetical protein